MSSSLVSARRARRCTRAHLCGQWIICQSRLIINKRAETGQERLAEPAGQIRCVRADLLPSNHNSRIHPAGEQEQLRTNAEWKAPAGPCLHHTCEGGSSLTKVQRPVAHLTHTCSSLKQQPFACLVLLQRPSGPGGRLRLPLPPSPLTTWSLNLTSIPRWDLRAEPSSLGKQPGLFINPHGRNKRLVNQSGVSRLSNSSSLLLGSPRG